MGVAAIHRAETLIPFAARLAVFGHADFHRWVSSMTKVQPSPETRLHILAARQAALTEVLEQFNRLTIAARDEVLVDGGPKALERSWRRLHHWLAEAGRENQIELSLLRHEMATTIDQADVVPKAKHSRSTSGIFSRFRSRLMSS